MLFESWTEVKWLSCYQCRKQPICEMKGHQVWNIWRWKPVPFGDDSDPSFIWTECRVCSESDTSQSANQAKSSFVSVLFPLRNFKFSKLNVILQQVKNLQVSLLAENTHCRFDKDTKATITIKTLLALPPLKVARFPRIPRIVSVSQEFPWTLDISRKMFWGYKEDLPLVLKGLTFSTNAGERLGPLA